MATARDLTHLEAFRLGDMSVSPSTCEVVTGTRLETIEPLVMRVLLVLAGAGGRTVARDELVERCWDGRAISEDAINRVIGRLRRLARDVGGTSFVIHTVPRVGYRLVAAEAELPLVRPSTPPSRQPPLRQWRLAGTLAIVALLGLMLVRGIDASQPAEEPSSATLAARDLGMRGAAAVFAGTPDQTDQAIVFFRRALAASPGDADLWASLALAYALRARDGEAGDAILLRERARQASRRALALEPRNGHALAAERLASLATWEARDAGWRSAEARSDGRSPAPVFWRGRFLVATGRLRDGLARVERAWAVHPLVPWIAAERITLLAAAGREDEAEAAADEAGRTWPHQPEVWRARFLVHALGGDPADARGMTVDPRTRPARVAPDELSRLLAAADALATPTRTDDSPALARFDAAARTDPAAAAVAFRLALRFGDRPRALAGAERLLATGSDQWTEALFLPPADQLWTDPRLMAAARRAGLVELWRRFGAPDLCTSSAAAACASEGVISILRHQRSGDANSAK